MDAIKPYRGRVSDRLLKEQLEAAGIVLVQGPKWCGKTTTAIHAARSVLFMDDPKLAKNYLSMAENDPVSLFEGEKPRVIDEWQLAPKLWDAARYEVDRRCATGWLVFTGSAVPADMSQVKHTGTGRFGWLTMRPMSLWESGESNGRMSLLSLFAGNATDAVSIDMTLERIAYLVCRGGWPGALSMSESSSLRHARNYVDAVCNSDITRVDGVSRDPSLARLVMRSFARYQGAQATIGSIAADVSSSRSESVSNDTVASYLKALKNIFVIEDMPAWNPNLRSKTAIRTSNTRYFVDPSIAAASLGVGPKDLMGDLSTLGLLFETLAVRDLRVFAEALDGYVDHYRDRNGLECDAVVHLRNGSYGLVEIKIGGDTLIEEGAKTLTKLASRINTDNMGKPAFMMILTALGPYAFRRSDGIWIVPIGCLKD